MDIEPRDFLTIFLRFSRFEPHFLINFFLIKKTYIVNLQEYVVVSKLMVGGNQFQSGK